MTPDTSARVAMRDLQMMKKQGGMLTRRDLELIRAVQLANNRGDAGQPRQRRRGCRRIPGCTPLLFLFFVCGLPIDLLILAKVFGLIK